MNHQKSLLFVFIFMLAFFTQTGSAQTLLLPGAPDPDFGTNGRVVTPLNGGCNIGDVILLPDSKIIELCTKTYRRNEFTDYYFVLVRHNPDGSPDNTFGVNGVQTIPVGEGLSQYYFGKSLYLQPDGKILIGGTLNDDFGLMRVNSDGSLDKSFGTNGRVSTDLADFEEISRERFYGLAVRPDGRLVAYGKSIVQIPTVPCNLWEPWCHQFPEFERLAIAQYNPDGSADMSFGTRGIQRTRILNDTHHPQSVVIEPDGKLLFIAGAYERIAGNGTYFTQVAVRYNTDGNLDADFGKDGMKELPNAVIYSLPDGKFLTYETCQSYQPCNDSNTGYNYNTRFSRLNSDLTADSTFGFNGTVPYSLYYNDPGTIYRQPDGKFILSSYRTYANDGSFTGTYLYRFNSDGSLDYSFGSNGVIGFDLDNSNTIASNSSKVIIYPDGKILVVGAFYPPLNTTGPSGVVMMRFIGRKSGKFGF